jgi:hypothetical protein
MAATILAAGPTMSRRALHVRGEEVTHDHLDGSDVIPGAKRCMTDEARSRAENPDRMASAPILHTPSGTGAQP